MKSLFFWPHITIEGFWQDRSVRKNGARLYGRRVSKFLSHRIVKSSTFRMYGKLKFQCSRNGPQNPLFCPGSIQDTFIICPSVSHRHIFQNMLQTKLNKSKNWKIKNPGSLTSAQTPANMFGETADGIARKTTKGVLDRPWTKWRVFNATSSTLKFQITINPESWRFDYSVRQKIGDLGPIKLRTIFPHTYCQNPHQLQYEATKSSFAGKPIFPGSLTSA